MNTQHIIIAVAAVLSVSGCANMGETITPTAASLQNKVAGNLGYQPSSVTIRDLREATGITYFVASTPKGSYGCSIPSDGLTAYATLGIVNLQPTCTKQ